MTITIPHHTTKDEAISLIDKGSDTVFSNVVGNSVEITDRKKEWDGSTMNFSFTGRLGFISVPFAGTMSVDDTNVTVDCELPPMVKNFIGEEKLSGSIESELKRLF